MIKTLAFIAFVIDSLVFIYVLLRSYVERNDYKKINEAIINKTEENLENSKNKPEKFGVLIGAMIFVIVLIGISLIPIIIFIVKWVNEGLLIGLRYFLIYSLFWPIFNAFRRTIKVNKTVTNEKQKLTILMFISGVFISIMYTIFGLDLTLFDVISFYSSSDTVFSYTLSIMMPSLLIASIFLTFFSAISKITLLNIEDKYYPHWTYKYPFVLTIFVLSIYYTLLFLSELSFEEKIIINYINMVDVISIIQNLLAAALIPLIIGIFLNANSERKDKIIAEKEITNSY